MPTENPKISAYVPQHIYDRFKIFYEERRISMSQAVAVIFAEYFELDLSVDQKSSTSGLLVERVGLLEEELADLRELVQKHLQSGGAVQEKEDSVVHNGGLPEDVSLEAAEPISITPSEPPEEYGSSEAESLEVLKNVEASSVEGDLPENIPSESVSGLHGELLGDGGLAEREAVEVKSPEVIENVETPLADGGASEIAPEGSVEDIATKVKVDNPVYNLLGEPVDEIKPIPGIKLSKFRFGLSEAMIAGKKRDKSLEEFTRWTKDRDPDGIAWKYVLTPSKGYLPVDELSSELRDKLLTWMRENGLL